MARLLQAAAGLLLLLTPFAGASDPFAPRVCDAAAGCVGPGACVPGVFCQATVCDPALECEGSLVAETQCGANETSVGETCQRRVGFGAAVGRSLSAPVVGAVQPVPVGAAVVLTDGNVTGRDLPNAWLSHSAHVSAPVAGDTSLTVYRSVITVDGARDDVDTFLFPEADHTFSELGVAARHSSGTLGRADVVVGLVLLDLKPEGCFLRSSTGFGPVFECPRVQALA